MADIKSILDPAQVPGSVKADAWDAYHASGSTADLQSRLDKLALPKEVKAALWDAKAAEAPQHPTTWSDRLGLTNPIARGVTDAAEGATAGAASTIFNGGDLIRRMVGAPRIVNNPDVQQAMSTPDSFAGRAGKFVEQGAEFAVPLAKVGAATRGASLLARTGAEALTSGGVAAVQSGGDPTATGIGAVLGAAGPVVGAAAGATGKAVAGSRIPQKVYQSALKPTWSMVRKQGLEMLDTGIKEQIPVSARGLTMVEDKIASIRDEITKGIQAHSAMGRTVDTSKVLSTLDDLEKFYSNTAAPEDALNTIKSLKLEFEQYHGTKIPIDKAQKLKINTYQLLKDSYGEMASAKVEGLKQIVRGLKEQISQVFPEIAGLNEQQSKLIGLDEALYRAVWRIENHQLMGIGSPIAATAGHAVLGGPGAMAGLLGKFVLDDPGIKSKVAIALANAGKANPGAAASKGLTALRGALQESFSRAQSSGQPLPAGAQ